MTGPTAPRPAATRSGGGAPAYVTRIGDLMGRGRDVLEALEGRTLRTLAPHADDIEGAVEALENVAARLAGVPLGTPPPRPAPRHDTAVAEAAGVLVPAGPELEDLPDAHEDLEAERGRRIEGSRP